MEVAAKCSVLVAESDQLYEAPHDKTLQLGTDLPGAVIVPINIPSYACTREQIHIVLPGQQTDVVHLRDPRRKELDRARQQIFLISPSQCVVKRAIHLIEIKIARRRSGSLSARSPTALMDSFHQRIDSARFQQTRAVCRVAGIGCDVDDPNTVMCIEHGDRIARTHRQPSSQGTSILLKQCVQYKWRQGEVVHAIHLTRNFNLIPIVAVDFDQDLHAESMSTRGQLRDVPECLRDHEASGAGALDRVPDSIQSDQPNACPLELLQNCSDVSHALFTFNIDVDLLRRERGPQQALFAILHPHYRERQTGTWPIDPEQLSFTRSPGKYAVERQEQLGELRRVAFLREILELRRLRGDVIHDQISRQLDHVTKFFKVLPSTEPRIDVRVVNRIEPRVRAVNWREERQQVHSAEEAPQGTFQLRAQLGNPAARKAIYISDQLDAVLNRCSLDSFRPKARMGRPME